MDLQRKIISNAEEEDHINSKQNCKVNIYRPRRLMNVSYKYRTDILEREQSSPIKLLKLPILIDHKSYDIPSEYIQTTVGSLFYNYYLKSKDNKDILYSPLSPTHEIHKSKYYWNEMCITFVKEKNGCRREEICPRIHVLFNYVQNVLSIDIQTLSYMYDNSTLYGNHRLVVFHNDVTNIKNEEEGQYLEIPFASVYKTKGSVTLIENEGINKKTYKIYANQICPFFLNAKCYYKSRCKNFHVDRTWWKENNHIFDVNIIVTKTTFC